MCHKFTIRWTLVDLLWDILIKMLRMVCAEMVDIWITLIIKKCKKQDMF